AAGNLYGTTVFGGAGSAGTVFKVAPDRTETVLHSFTGGSDGIYPVGGLIRIKHNLYGTTFEGGASNAGTVFKITSDGKEKVLYSFTGGSDGGNPLDSLIKDAAGTLYGTTGIGGNTACDNGG